MVNIEQDMNKQTDKNEGPVTQSTMDCSKALEILQIVHALNKTNANNPDEHLELTNLTHQFMDKMHTEDDKCTVTLTRKERFGLWLCVDIYRAFSIETSNEKELKLANELMSLLSEK
jgi:hypothetical protein